MSDTGTGSGRGGLRRPARPATFSGEGRNSRRTDSGPALTEAPSEEYGERAARNRGIRAIDDESQQPPTQPPGAAPGAGTPPPGAGAGPNAGPNPAAGLAEQLFAPDTDARPVTGSRNEPRNEVLPENRFAFLEELYRSDPNPDLLELLQMQTGRGQELIEHDRGTEAVFPGDPDVQDIDPAYRMDLDVVDPSTALDFGEVDPNVSPGLPTNIPNEE